MIPYAHFKNRAAANLRNIRLSFASAPQSLSVTKCLIRFDKSFVFSWSMDDTLGDCAFIGIPYFKGGNVVEEDGIHPNCPGKFYTDGCGNDVPFNFNLRVVGSWISTADFSGYYMNEKDFRKAYIKGCAYINHSFTHLAGGMSSDPAIRYPIIRAEILDNFEAVKARSGIRMFMFNYPGGTQSDYYASVAYDLCQQGNPAVRMIAALNPQASTLEFSGTRVDQLPLETYLQRGEIGWGGIRYWDWKASKINGATDAQILSPIEAKLAITTPTQHWWFSAGSHSLGLNFGAGEDPGLGFTFATFSRFFDLLENTYGKYGQDNMWMESDLDVWEYLRCYKNSLINVIAPWATTRDIRVDFSQCDPQYRFHTLSMVVQADQEITGIQITGYDSASFKIGHKNLGNGSALINIRYMPQYEKSLFRRLDALVAVEDLEFTRLYQDKLVADDKVGILLNGSYKNALLTRIAAVTIYPAARTILIDFGSTSTTYPTAYPWNNFSAASNTYRGVGHSIGPLTSMDSQMTPFYLTLTDGTDQLQTVQIVSGGSYVDGGIYPKSAIRDMAYVDPGRYAVFTLTGLDAEKKYDVKCFGNRSSSASMQRYTVNGQSLTLEAKGNISATADFLNITAVTQITIRFEGNTPSVAGRLNVLEIIEHS